MDITQESTGNLTAIVTIKLTPEDYQENYDKAIGQYRKQMNLPGFRAGKVPVSVVKQRYGKSVLAEEVNKVLNGLLNKHITESKLDILGNPMPSEKEHEGNDWDNPKDFEFSFELGLAPEFDLTALEKNKFTYHKVKVDQKLIDKQALDLAKRYGKLVDSEKSEEKDLLFGEFIQLDKKDIEVEGGIRNSTTVSLEFIEDKKTKKKLIGLVKGDSAVIDPHKVSKGHDDLARVLGVDHEAVHNIKTNYKFEVKEIKTMIPAEFNQDLFDKVYGEGAVGSEEEFKNKIQEELSGMFMKDSDFLFKKNLKEKLLGKLKLNLPDEFLKRWIIVSNEKPVNPEELEKDYPNYSDDLRWQLVENKLIQEKDIKVEFEEVKEFIKTALINQYAQYSMPAPEPEALEEQVKNILSKESEARRVYEDLYSQKVLSYLKSNVKLTEKETSYDDFVKLATAS